MTVIAVTCHCLPGSYFCLLTNDSIIVPGQLDIRIRLDPSVESSHFTSSCNRCIRLYTLSSMHLTQHILYHFSYAHRNSHAQSTNKGMLSRIVPFYTSLSVIKLVSCSILFIWQGPCSNIHGCGIMASTDLKKRQTQRFPKVNDNVAYFVICFPMWIFIYIYLNSSRKFALAYWSKKAVNILSPSGKLYTHGSKII